MVLSCYLSSKGRINCKNNLLGKVYYQFKRFKYSKIIGIRLE